MGRARRWYCATSLTRYIFRSVLPPLADERDNSPFAFRQPDRNAGRANGGPAAALALDRPHRNAFYKTGLCLRGSARLRVNLETYELRPASLIVLSPYTNMQCVTRRPADCEARRGPTVQAATGVRWSIHSILPPRLSPG
jgi:hypothetical protein